MNTKIFLPAAAVLLAACTKSADMPASGQTEELSITVTAPSTKTAFSDHERKMLWDKDDIIHVYDENGNMREFVPAMSQESRDAAVMKFTCRSWENGRTPSIAVCGGTTTPLTDAASGRLSTEIPPVQTVDEGDCIDSDAAVLAGLVIRGNEDGYSVGMRHIYALLRFELANADAELEAIALTDAGGKDIAGTVSVTWKDDIPECAISEGKKCLTLRSQTKITDGAYYVCIFPGQEITPVVTFTLSGGKQASYTHPEKVSVIRGGITDLGIIDGSIVFDKPYTLTLDFLNWNETMAYPNGSDIDAKGKFREFHTKSGHLIESTAPLGRTAAYGLYSFSEVTAGSSISLPAVPGMRLVKVAADLGGMPSKGYPNNSGAPYIAAENGTVVKGGVAAENAQFVIPEQGESEPDSEPYVWSLSGTEEETVYRLTFTEGIQSFGLQSLVLSYTGEQFDDISGIITEDGNCPASRQMTMNGNFTTVGGMFTNTFCGFRYRPVGSATWSEVAVNEHSSGRFSATVSLTESGDYEFCAYASLGDKEVLRRYGVPKTVHVTGEPVTLEAVDFSAATLPAKADEATGELVVKGADGYEYKVSGQDFDDDTKVYYYAYKSALYFGRSAPSVDGNACGFIELPSIAGHILKSIKITDTGSNKTYRVYDSRKSVYESSDRTYLGTVTNNKSTGTSVLNVSGAEQGKAYWLCCPIFSYVSKIEVTYEK